MRAVTVRNPWAWAIVAGRKPVENRGWRTSHRGPLLIHAGRAVEPLATYPDGSAVPAPARTGPGAVIGVVELVDCVPVGDVPGSPWACGPWCWVLGNPRAFAEPVPYRGAQLLFHVPDDLLPEWCRA